MSGVFRYLRRVLGFSKPQQSLAKSANKLFQNATFRDLTRFAEGDRVLVDGSKLTFPLAKNAKFELAKGQLQFNDIIGKPVTSAYIRSSRGSLHKVELPSLEEYVTLTPRLVTPVYASYASTIVSLLDIHPELYIETGSANYNTPRRIEILEAGTGHGSLTLHLARAIAAANPPPPTIELPKIRRLDRLFLQEKQDSTTVDVTEIWTEWKATRRAIIHTVEAAPSYSIHAEKIVRGFRRGLYWPYVDFYASDVKTWLTQHSNHASGEAEFLDYVLLDMPGVHEQLRYVAPAMRDGAKLVVFVPSITQIGDCVRIIAEERLSLEANKVLELGEGISTGRKWDVRFVRPRERSNYPGPGGDEKNSVAAQSRGQGEAGGKDSTSESDTASEDVPEDEIERIATSTSRDRAPVMICRPLVGERTFGGGFIALFKKISPASAALTAEWQQTQTGRARRRNR